MRKRTLRDSDKTLSDLRSAVQRRVIEKAKNDSGVKSMLRRHAIAQAAAQKLEQQKKPHETLQESITKALADIGLTLNGDDAIDVIAPSSYNRHAKQPKALEQFDTIQRRYAVAREKGDAEAMNAALDEMLALSNGKITL